MDGFQNHVKWNEVLDKDVPFCVSIHPCCRKKWYDIHNCPACKRLQKYGKVTKFIKKNLRDTIECFSKVAGPKLNIYKTECILTGSFINMYENESFIEDIK